MSIFTLLSPPKSLLLQIPKISASCYILLCCFADLHSIILLQFTCLFIIIKKVEQTPMTSLWPKMKMPRFCILIFFCIFRKNCDDRFWSTSSWVLTPTLYCQNMHYYLELNPSHSFKSFFKSIYGRYKSKKIKIVF